MSGCCIGEKGGGGVAADGFYPLLVRNEIRRGEWSRGDVWHRGGVWSMGRGRLSWRGGIGWVVDARNGGVIRVVSSWMSVMLNGWGMAGYR